MLFVAAWWSLYYSWYSLLTLMVMATTNANFGAKHVQNGN